MGRRTGGDDRRGDVDATGKKLTRAQVSSRSTVRLRRLQTETSVVPRFRRQGRILAQKKFAGGVL